MVKILAGIFLLVLAQGCTRQSIEGTVIALKLASNKEVPEEFWDEQDPDGELQTLYDDAFDDDVPGESLYPHVPIDGLGTTTPAKASGRTYFLPPENPPVYDPKKPFPPLPKGITVEGFTQYDLRLPRPGGASTHILLYVPEHQDPSTLGCVLIPPGWSDLTMGMHLAQEDMAEHLPYLDFNMIVAAFSISGGGEPNKGWPGSPPRREYFQAKGGIVDAQKTLDYVLHHFPTLDKSQVFASGHGSGGTLALQLTAKESRIKGCMVYAPVTWYSQYADMAYKVNAYTSIRDYTGFIYGHEPAQLVADITVPIFVYHSKQDGLVPIRQSERFIGKLKHVNPNVTLKTGETGQHYASMMEEGIPEAIMWMLHLRGEQL